jgi:UDP-3-O-[3-hydroxymyristoyl] glucosamine N-acyltransferase
MTDDRFFERAGPFPLGQIAAHVGAEMDNSSAADFLISDVSNLDTAEAGEISLYTDAKYAASFAKTRASVVITAPKLAAHEHNGAWLLLSADPRLAFAQVGHLFYPPTPLHEGLLPVQPVHPTPRSARVRRSARAARSARARRLAPTARSAPMS